MVLEMPTKSKRREALEILPTDLYNAFQLIISRIQNHIAAQAQLGVRVLMWLHFAHRPLKLVELQHALAVEKNHTELDVDNIPPMKALLDSCLGLVVVDEETLIVRFVHYTLQEYFRNNIKAEFPDGYTYIAETCLTYLNFGQLKHHCTSKQSLEEKMDEYMFLKYAARYWGTYIQQQCDGGLMKLIEMIVAHESKYPPCAIQALQYQVRGSNNFPYKKFSGIHSIAYFGLGEIMAYCCKKGQYKELKDDNGRTPLSWAAEKGHEAVVRLLIKRGDVDINTQDKSGKTPLSWAAAKGHEVVVRLLIERGDVDINTQDEYKQTPLTLAAEQGHEAVVRLLVERDDVDINTLDPLEQTPLLWAAMKGHEAVVRLLVERDNVLINTKDVYGRTPLSWAAEEGYEAVVRLLIERDDVDINAKDEYGLTPLSLAARQGHEAVVQLLIERCDVDVNTRDEDGRTPLSLAAMQGHEAVVRLLIERDDVDINIPDDKGWEPFSLAARRGHEAVVQLLLKRST